MLFMSYTNFPSTIFLEKHDMINNMINSIARTNMGQHKYALEVDIGFLAPGSRRMIPVEQRASIFQVATARGSLSSVLTICLRQCNPLSQHKSSRYFSCTIWFFFFSFAFWNGCFVSTPSPTISYSLFKNYYHYYFKQSDNSVRNKTL